MQFIVENAKIIIELLGIVVVQFLATGWVKTRLEASIKLENDRVVEEYKYEIRAKEQAAKIAEYFAYYFRLKAESSESDYRTANKLAWELALWLPQELYLQVREAVVNPDNNSNILSTIVAARKLLLKNPGSLTSEDIFFHAPNAGLHKNP